MTDRTQARQSCWLLAIAAVLCVFQSPALLAQTEPDQGLFGLKYTPDATAVLDLPFGSHWGMRSSIASMTRTPGQGLKVGIAGTYGWDYGTRTRVAFAAGVVSIEQPSLLPGMAVGVNRLQFGGGARGVDARDISFNLSVDWRYSRALSITTGVDVSYSLLDPMPLDWQSASRPTNSTGYVGLKYRF
jgi:hypothetical protein